MSELLINPTAITNSDSFKEISNYKLLWMMFLNQNLMAINHSIILESLQKFVDKRISINLSNRYDQENQRLFLDTGFEAAIENISLNLEEECYVLKVAGSFRDKDCIFRATKIVAYFDGVSGLEVESGNKTYCFLTLN